MIDLFRPAMNPDAGRRLTNLFAPDENGRIYIGEGKATERFEQELGRRMGLDPHPLAVNSCTAAIDLALHLCSVEDGDEVISTPMTCTATNGPVVNRDASIVWADIDPITGLIDPADVARKVDPVMTMAIIAVDWGGRSCDYNALREVADGVPIIQDAAHRFSIDPNNHGDYVCWSFGPIKHLTCGGYGGALLPPEDQRERARLLRWHGLDRLSKADFRCDQRIMEAGYRYHMTDDMATVGLANLEIVENNIRRGCANAYWYTNALKGAASIELQPYDFNDDHWLFTILVDDRDSLSAFLTERGIGNSPVHARNDVHPAFHFPNGPLPGVDSFASRELAIPTGWWVTDHDRERVAAAVIEWGAR